MADVIVKILCAGGFDVDHRINEDLLKLRSAYCRKELGSMLPRVHGSPKTLPIIADPPAISNAIQTILNLITKQSDSVEFKIPLNVMGKEKTARVWQASKMLQLEPRQLHLRTYVRGFIAHDKLRANLVKDVHLAFYDTRGERLTNKQGEVDKRSTWDTLVHHLAYDTYHDEKYTKVEIAEIMNAIKDPHPELFDAINSRIEELKAGTAKGEETKRQRVEEKERKKAFAQENRERRERVEQQKTGQRTLSDGIARQIMTAPPAALFATVQDRKHGKRNPPGQGKRGFKGKDAEGKEEGGEQ